MTQAELIAMAKQANEEYGWGASFFDIEKFAKLVERYKCEELAKKIEAMPFGDTAASFAIWVREQA